MATIAIRNDNGFEECLTCKNWESNECRMCSDADLYEEMDDAGESSDRRELEFA